MAKTVINKPSAKKDVLENSKGLFPLSKINFIWMGISALLIIVGFILMLGGSSTETAFNPDIFSTRRLIVGPTIAFLGFALMAVAIMLKSKKSTEQPDNN